MSIKSGLVYSTLATTAFVGTSIASYKILEDRPDLFFGSMAGIGGLYLAALIKTSREFKTPPTPYVPTNRPLQRYNREDNRQLNPQGIEVYRLRRVHKEKGSKIRAREDVTERYDDGRLRSRRTRRIRQG